MLVLSPPEMPKIPLLWKLLLGFLYTCMLASALAWFVLLSNICSNPRTVMAATHHTTPYSCHGATVFISPLENVLLRWLGPVGFIVIILCIALTAVMLVRMHNAHDVK